MVEIELSVMVGAPGGENHLLPLLEEFRKQSGIRVTMIEVPWDNGWAEIVKFGIYGHGPAVSSVGTTWIGSLASMQALRAYSDQEIRALGGAEAFFESLWRTGFLLNDPTLWAVPWRGDVRLLYYWKDALEKAGIRDFKAAFSNDAALAETLEKLRKSGISHPIVLATTNTSMILHQAAHWVWNAGGDFISTDGRQVAFNQPPAMQGFRDYFGLRPFMPPKMLGVEDEGKLFLAKKAAILFSGPWLGTSIRQNPDQDENAPDIIALPGTTFTGGCGLVIWDYTPHPEEAFKLVHFLATLPVHAPNSPTDHQVPTRCEALHAPLMENDVFHRAYLESMQRGRSFPTMRLWGAVEDKLRVELGDIWAELFANPDQNVDECLHRHLDPLAARLNITLGN